MTYIETILLECLQIMNMHIGLLEALPRSKVKVPGNLVHLKGSKHLATFTVLLLDLL